MAALIKGRNFWDGNPRAWTHETAFRAEAGGIKAPHLSFKNNQLLREQGWQRLSDGRRAHAGGVERQFINAETLEGEVINELAGVKSGDVLSQSSNFAAKGRTNFFGKEVVTTTIRMGRDGKAIEVIFKDGTKIDINAARVKQWTPNPHPNAPAGTLQKVKFDNSLPGSKGYKRKPTQSELDFLNGL